MNVTIGDDVVLARVYLGALPAYKLEPIPVSGAATIVSVVLTLISSLRERKSGGGSAH
jgi:hypothetical protein